MRTVYTSEHPCIVDFNEPFNERNALVSLRVGSRWLRRSHNRALLGAAVSLVLYLVFCWQADQLAALRIIPDQSVVVPPFVTTFVVFMMAGALTMLVSSSLFFHHRSMDGVMWLTQWVESTAEAIAAHEMTDEQRAEGLNILKHRIYSMVLFISGIPFKQRGRKGGKLDNLVIGNGRFACWCQQVGLGSLITASSGSVRINFARGAFAVIRRFGLRPGLVWANVLYIVTFLGLLWLGLRGYEATMTLVFRAGLVSLLTFLVTMLLSVAHNNSDPLLELSGTSSHGGLADRLTRLIDMVNQTMLEAGYPASGGK